MEMYNLSEYGNTETYLIQSTDLNIHHSGPSLGQLGAMYADGASEFAVEQGLYYQPATNYGYICTGYEPSNEWDDHPRIFGVDGQEVQYTGSQTENFPYMYFAPSYGHTQSPYNPYNPYIPGAMLGVDSYTGSQQFYSIPSNEQQIFSPAYYPMVVQSGPDIISGGATDLFFDTGGFTANRSNVPGVKDFSSTSATFTGIPTKAATNQTHSFVSAAEGLKTSAGPSKLPAAHGIFTSSTLSSLAPSKTRQGRSVEPVDDILQGKVLSHRDEVKMASVNELSNLHLSAHGRVSSEKIHSKFQYGSSDGVNGSSDAMIDGNQGATTNISKSHLAVKAYTTRAGDSDAKGNITIYTDQYNKDEFVLDYVNAKFFVIKSYSEDDVHKSIKYNVWSSTPNGNKKLQSAYEDARGVSSGIPGGCPIFLFFSVNASGQFCGVAEMIGPVDFNNDMDFWQQDKWSGSFPVRWHFIKDVPNPCFRHIILENNENKPVTNSRDTQEIRYKQGIEMLKIFKSYTVKTSLLDDFMYYENRQKIMQEEKARLLLIKSYGSAFLVPPALDPPRKQSFLVIKSSEEEVGELGKRVDPPLVAEQLSLDSSSNARRLRIDEEKNIADEAQHDDEVSSSLLKIGSLTINPKQAEPVAAAAAKSKPVVDNNIVTVGSMPVTVNTSCDFLTVGSISLDPKALQTNDDEPGAAVKSVIDSQT